jgi:predicted AAA+ superfamily ATPase
MIERILNLDLANRQSCFLWGPRQTGKSTLLRERFPGALYYDLLRAAEFRRLSANPGLLREEAEAFAVKGGQAAGPIIIDEVQKLPELVDEVHSLISRRGLHFILCGSSARKLVRGGGNLLGGRAARLELLPFTSAEVPAFSLERALNHGLLPRHYLGDEPAPLLEAYVGEYLREEVLAESLTRNLPAFQRFLEVAALSHGQVVNLANIAREVGLSAPTIRGYFEILTDTLLGRWVPAWRKRAKRRVVEAPRFFFFDVGVVNELARRGQLKPGSSEFGAAFEHFIWMELRAHAAYRGQGYSIAYWRTSSGFEVDFILGDGSAAIEVKSTENPTIDHMKGLRAWKEEQNSRRHILVCRAPRARRTEDGIDILPWPVFLERLWNEEIPIR